MLNEKTKQAASALKGRVKTKVAAAAQLTNKYLLIVIAVVLGLYICAYPEMLTKMWVGLTSYSDETGAKITFEALFQAVLFSLCATYIMRRFKHVLEDYLLAKLKMNTGVKHTIITLISYGIWIFIALMTLSILGIQLKNLAILFGALSVGIGFGLQNIVNNFVSGIIILFERPIKEGDWVVINNQEGIVRHVRIRATELETFDNASILIPNADILSGQVVNWTHANLNGRFVVPLSVAYGSDLEKVNDVLLDVAKAEPRLLPEPAPYVWFTKFADSGIELELRGVTGNVISKGAIRSDLMIKISKAFEKEGIEIPFPQQVVYLKNDAQND